ncbi:MAG: HD domain-containing protein [Gemmataceae bacterium]|uniref:HD domain-containing protein n=1 Tax=Thermogemmata fonticola TaxID=2755323 RepID=A0A7V8VDU4_9BACT|nr:HD domain-containing protein [Thermogemmata fonticola]MBA2226200.1 HD domain-containing protein [Thermogemmata fonticola]MCX8141079.1 HD domain-containing protein [Gemmataceae bacterium]
MRTFEEVVLAAVSFAARAHRHQLRKDGRTPYVAHPLRVALIVRHLLGCGDEEVLAAAVLHDCLEDTDTDYDDLAAAFGEQVARWVAALSKDCRLPEEQREEAYCRQLRAADWQVHLLKLADMYDNLTDSAHLEPFKRAQVVRKVRRYLEALRPTSADPPLVSAARRLVEQALSQLEQHEVQV